MPQIIYVTAQALSQIAVMRFLFPLLAVVGPVMFFYYGHMGVTQRRTLSFAVRRYSSNKDVRPGVSIEGTAAVALGAFYLVTGVVLAFVMLPIAGAMFAIW